MTIPTNEKHLRVNELAIILSDNLSLPDDKISIVDINNIPSYLAINVIEDGKVLLSNNKYREMKEIQRIYSMFEYEKIANDHFKRFYDNLN